MNVSLAEGDSVRFEDLGGAEPSVLANESILMKGLVVRSYSNQISVHFHSRRPCHGSFLLLYRGKCSHAAAAQLLCLCVCETGYAGKRDGHCAQPELETKPAYECTLAD